jgi:hypothetical protein
MTDRRTFFRDMTRGALNGAKQALQARDRVHREIAEVLDTLTGESPELEAFDRGFFDSYELSYSMTLTYPRDFFEQMAENVGIEHAGVETLELVKKLHQRGAI